MQPWDVFIQSSSVIQESNWGNVSYAISIPSLQITLLFPARPPPPRVTGVGRRVGGRRVAVELGGEKVLLRAWDLFQMTFIVSRQYVGGVGFVFWLVLITSNPITFRLTLWTSMSLSVKGSVMTVKGLPAAPWSRMTLKPLKRLFVWAPGVKDRRKVTY